MDRNNEVIHLIIDRSFYQDLSIVEILRENSCIESLSKEFRKEVDFSYYSEEQKITDIAGVISNQTFTDKEENSLFYQSDRKFIKNKPAGNESLSKVFEFNPNIPTIANKDLHHATCRINFIKQVYAQHNFNKVVKENLSYKTLLEFHSQYKYVLMAHNEQDYHCLGWLLADAKRINCERLSEQYFTGFMQTLKNPIGRRNHYNSILHLFGFLKRNLDQPEQQKFSRILDRYLSKEVELSAPIALLNIYINQYGKEYIQGQRYLEPYFNGK